MYKNPELVKKYRDEVNALEIGLRKAKRALFEEKSKVPDGYRLLSEGEIVAVGSINYEPCHGTWDKEAGGCVGKPINSQGFVTGVVHRGWKFANPMNVTEIEQQPGFMLATVTGGKLKGRTVNVEKVGKKCYCQPSEDREGNNEFVKIKKKHLRFWETVSSV